MVFITTIKSHLEVLIVTILRDKGHCLFCLMTDDILSHIVKILNAIKIH